MGYLAGIDEYIYKSAEDPKDSKNDDTFRNSLKCSARQNCTESFIKLLVSFVAENI